MMPTLFMACDPQIQARLQERRIGIEKEVLKYGEGTRAPCELP
jgi:hypothetical protein